MGFNAMLPGRVKKGDLVMLAIALVLLIAGIVWVVR
jgi:hypothetical protein